MNLEALQKAINHLSIQMVYLHSTEARLCNGFDPLIPNQELIGQFNIAVKSCDLKEIQEDTGNRHKILVFRTEARMRYFKGPLLEEMKEALSNEDQVEKLTASEIIATFTSEYAIIGIDELEKEAVAEFARVNVPHQIWPYWREYCQSTCARMSLPVSVMPMYVINKVKDEENCPRDT
jgi:hypothetical protein